MNTLDKVRADFKNFLYLVWKHLGLPDPTPMQYQIADYLQYGPRREMIQAFRGIGKSWITAAFVLWLLLCDPQLKILVISAAQDRAEAFSYFTKQLIEDMPILAHLVPGKDQRSSMVQFDVGPAKAAQAPSVKCAGITGQITGSRADIIIADDVEVPKNSLTQLMRDRLATAIKEFDAILTTNRDANRIIYLGTPQTEMSIYLELPKRGFEVRTWTARYPEGEQLERMAHHLSPDILKYASDHPGEPTDSRFTDVDLMEREASYGRSGFALQFMLDTVISDADRYPLKIADLILHDVDATEVPTRLIWGSGPDQIVNELDAVGLTGDRWHRPIKTSDTYAAFSGAVMFVDPSGRGKDETSYAVVKYCYGMLYLVACGGYLDGYTPSTLESLAGVAKTHKVNLVIVEPNYGGGMFNQLFTPVLNAEYPKCGIEEAPWSKGQKEARIVDTLEPVMNQHRLVVARTVVEEDLKRAKEDRAYSLFYQMTRLTKDRGALAHDDRIEAVAGAVFYWIESMARDEKKADTVERARLQDLELKRFKQHVLGRKKTPRSMIRR